jgi:adenylate cyclase
MKPGADTQELERLLDARNERPESLTEIDAEIWRRFGQTWAVLVLDMCGFSRLTQRHGITHFLAMIRRLHHLVRPIVERYRGRLVKAEADNLFAVFGDVPGAFDCARAIHAGLETANRFLPAEWDLHAGIAVGYGPLLVLDGADLYGSEMNLASKLGEDVAEGGEILLTWNARAQLPADLPDVTEMAFEGSGLTLRAFRWPG